MTAPRGTVTLGTLTLVAEVGQYRPFSDVALGVAVFDGIEATTVQDFGFRAQRQEGTLSSGTGASPGLLSTATMAALQALLIDAYGVDTPLSDSLGNAGTVKVYRFAPGWEYHVPGAQGALHSYALTWRWVTLTTLYGTAYTGP